MIDLVFKSLGLFDGYWNNKRRKLHPFKWGQALYDREYNLGQRLHVNELIQSEKCVEDDDGSF